MKEQLPGFVLAELFSNSLVYTDDKSEHTIVKGKLPVSKKWYLGNYEKKIVVLVNDPENIYLNDECLDFLSGILNACKLNLAHIALINFNTAAVNFQRLKKELQPEFLLLFEVKALQIELPFTMPHYQVQQYDNCKILTAPSLTDLNQADQQSKTEKTKLWKSLQNMFNL